MKISTKAVLLSALVFPGAGHVYLKKYTTGLLLASVSFIAIYYLISNVIEKAFYISEKIQSGDIKLDIAAITESVSQESNGADIQLLNITTFAIIICWLIGIIDSYRVARMQGVSK